MSDVEEVDCELDVIPPSAQVQVPSIISVPVNFPPVNRAFSPPPVIRDSRVFGKTPDILQQVIPPAGTPGTPGNLVPLTLDPPEDMMHTPAPVKVLPYAANAVNFTDVMARVAKKKERPRIHYIDENGEKRVTKACRSLNPVIVVSDSDSDEYLNSNTLPIKKTCKTRTPQARDTVKEDDTVNDTPTIHMVIKESPSSLGVTARKTLLPIMNEASSDE